MFDIPQLRREALLIATACIRATTAVSNADSRAAIAQLGERQTEDLKVPGSIPGLGIIADYAPWLALNRSPYEHVRS